MINVEGKEITKPSEIAEHFNDFFAAIGPKLSSLIEDTQHKMRKTSESQSMYLFPCTYFEVVQVINSIQPKHTSGIDEISNLFLKKAAYIIAPYLTYLINLSFNNGSFPSCLKFAKVLPLHKNALFAKVLPSYFAAK